MCGFMNSRKENEMDLRDPEVLRKITEEHRRFLEEEYKKWPLKKRRAWLKKMVESVMVKGAVAQKGSAG